MLRCQARTASLHKGRSALSSRFKATQSRGESMVKVRNAIRAVSLVRDLANVPAQFCVTRLALPAQALNFL